MKTFKILGILITAFTANVVLAQKDGGYGMGNGGDAVVCYTDATRSTITSVQMLDYWEQEQVVKYGNVDLGAANLSVQDKIQIAVNRISKFDTDLAEKIKFQALNLANNIGDYVVTSYQLPEIDDANPQVIPTQKNCFIEQYGVQYKDVVTGQRRFAIADKFYNFKNISNDEKAGLLLHEAIYRYAILQNPALNNSDGVRYFNYVVSSSKLNQLSLSDLDSYVNFLKLAGLEKSACMKKYGIYIAKQSDLDKSTYVCEGLETYRKNPYWPNGIEIRRETTTDVLCYNASVNFDYTVNSKANNTKVFLKGGSCIEVREAKIFKSNDITISNIKVLTPKNSKSNNIDVSILDSNGILVNQFQSNNAEFGLETRKVSLDISHQVLPLSNYYRVFKATTSLLTGGIKFASIAGIDQYCDLNGFISFTGWGDVSRCELNQKFTYNSFDYLLGETYKNYVNNIVTAVVINNEYKNKFKILGSQQNFFVIPSIPNKEGTYADMFGCDLPTALTTDLELISACINESTVEDGDVYIKDGLQRKLSANIRVNKDISGKFYIDARLNNLSFKDPRIKNLKIIFYDENSKYDAASRYCAAIGFRGTTGYSNDIGYVDEYVGGNGESFIDLNSNKTVFKTDEYVSYLNKVICSDDDRVNIYNY